MSIDEILVDRLTRHITDEMIRAMGWPRVGWIRSLFGRLVYIPANRFSRLAAIFDGWCSDHGLVTAAQKALQWFVDDYRIAGAEQIPQSGPLLIAGNHPGAYDGLVIMAGLPRQDIRFIASNMPFIQSLPHAHKHAIFATTDPHQRFAVVRESIRHLRDGGTLLIFPSGQIDPDPEALPGARNALASWSPSVEVMLRRVPEGQLMVAITSGVLARQCAHHPVTWLRKGGHESRRLAEFLQVIQQLLFHRRFDLLPKVSFGQPVAARELLSEESETRNHRIVRLAGQMLDAHLSHWALPELS